MTEKNNTAPTSEKSEGDVHYVRIQYTGVDDLRTTYANNVLIQHNPAGEFFLSFFDMPPPIVMGTEEEKAAQIKEISTMDARCVARIGLSKERMAAVIAAMAENYDKCLQRGKDQDASHGEKKHEQIS